ncbi:MAG: PAS domain-containing protein, partial [Clostridia bacterium]|nr:PAS domain-containing protein [Clostridia bacterium]
MLNFNTEFYQKLFRSLDNNAVLMRIEDDRTYYPIWCSHEFAEMMEGTEEEVLRLESASSLSTVHPDDQEAVAYLVKHHKAWDGSNSLVIRKSTVKGSEIWVKVHYAFVEEDGVQYAYCTYADITAIKREEEIAEIARRERDALRILHGLLHSGPWYMDFDEKGNMIKVTWTDTFRHMLGYESVDDFPDKLESWSDLLHEDDRERVLKEYNDTVLDYTGQKVYDVEYRLNTKDRGWRFFHAVGQLTRRPDGSPITYVGMFVDITEQKDIQKRLEEGERAKTMHNSMMEQFNVIADESLTVVRSNLSTGLIEDIRGRDLFPSDFAGNAVSEYVKTRMASFLRDKDRENYQQIFDIDNMLDRAARGLGPVTSVAYCRRASGRQCFVKFSGSASRNPLTGAVDAFGIETEYNAEMVTEVMNEKILAQQYDMVTYIVNGYYGVTIGDAANITRGSIFPKERDGIYMDYIVDQVLPVVPEAQRETIGNALSLDTVTEKLQSEETYTVDVACLIDGETFYKRFTYYTVDPESQFYILLKSDITDVIRDQGEREQTRAAYSSMLDQFNAMADQSLTVQRTNLTTGLIEESRGTDLYDTDYPGGSIVESARVRSESFLIEGDREKYEETFALDKLLERTGSGQGPATFVGYCRRQSGRQCFVKFSGSASRNPLTGDVTAFGVETEYNTEMVNEVMDEKVLAQQYDMITYIVSGYYSVAIGDAANISRGSIFPKQRNGIYMDYIRTQVLPVLAGSDGEKTAVASALSLEAIEAALAVDEPYIIDVACDIDGEIFNKRFMFYAVDRERHFYILLKSDITDVLQKQREQNELLATALREAEHANAAKTAFLSNMSHEIRTPM